MKVQFAACPAQSTSGSNCCDKRATHVRARTSHSRAVLSSELPAAAARRPQLRLYGSSGLMTIKFAAPQDLVESANLSSPPPLPVSPSYWFAAPQVYDLTSRVDTKAISDVTHVEHVCFAALGKAYIA